MGRGVSVGKTIRGPSKGVQSVATMACLGCVYLSLLAGPSELARARRGIGDWRSRAPCRRRRVRPGGAFLPGLHKGQKALAIRRRGLSAPLCFAVPFRLAFSFGNTH
jgi:hypothetical protein